MGRGQQATCEFHLVTGGAEVSGIVPCLLVVDDLARELAKEGGMHNAVRVDMRVTGRIARVTGPYPEDAHDAFLVESGRVLVRTDVPWMRPGPA